MIQYERRQQILRYLEEHQSATVRELAATVFASEASVRRDLESLEEQGHVRRTYGGVLLSQYRNSVVPFDLRDAENSAAKEQIAKRAADMIPDGSTVMLDASSTARRIVKYLAGRRDLKIITNSQKLFDEPVGAGIELYCTGGAYRPQNHDFVGAGAERYLAGVTADLLFFSSQGISEDGEISDVSEEETSLRRVMLSRAKRKFFLCDASKLGVRRVFTLCYKDDLDGILCNVPLPWEDAFGGTS